MRVGNVQDPAIGKRIIEVEKPQILWFPFAGLAVSPGLESYGIVIVLFVLKVKGVEDQQFSFRRSRRDRRSASFFRPRSRRTHPG